MSRRRAAEKRTILPDHKFKDLVLAKFMNRIMEDGKKSVSERIVYGAFDLVSKKTDKSPIDFFHEALSNVKPTLEVRSRSDLVQSQGTYSMRARISSVVPK